MNFLLAIGIGINISALTQLVQGTNLRMVSTRIGVAILMLWIVRFGFVYIKFEPYAFDYPFLLLFDQSLLLLDGLLLWLYARSLLKPIQFTWRILIHLLPFILSTSIAVINVTSYPEELALALRHSYEAFEKGQPLVSVDVVIFIVGLMVLNTGYLIFSIREVRKYNYSLFFQFSNIERLKGNWVVTFQWLWMVFFILPVLLYFGNYLFPILSMEMIGHVLILSWVLLSVFFNANVIRQDYTTELEEVSSQAAGSTSLTEEDQRLIAHLQSRMESQKFYQEDSLNLNQLAGYLEMKPVALTELIKKTDYENFYDLVNSYRVEAVKQALTKSKEQVIVLAYQQGFNSKSTFNKIFKEKTGMTPREYRMSHK